jgi:DNA-binding XRE family transcriptional regulator
MSDSNAEIDWSNFGDYVNETCGPRSLPPRPRSAVRLQEHRERVGLTRSQLAKRSHLPCALIIKLEQGLEEPDEATAATLAAVLQIDASQISVWDKP